MFKNNLTLQYFIAVSIYGTISYFLHFVNATSEFVVMCRGLLGSLFIYLVLKLQKKQFNKQAIKENLKYMIISGISLGLNWLTLFTAFKYSISLANLCNYTAPIFVVIISSIFYGNKLSKIQIGSIFFSFIGIVLISGIFDKNNNIDIRAIIFGFLACICFVVLVLCNQKLKSIEPLEKTFVQLLISALTVLPYIVINKSFPTSLDTRSIIILIILGFIHTGLAYIFYFDAVGKIESSKIAIIGYVEPVLSIFMAVILLNEYISIQTLVGGVLIIISALVSELFNK